MISVYLGVPGAGKSYAAVIQCVEALIQHRNIYTNLPLVKEKIAEYALNHKINNKPRTYHSVKRRLRVMRYFYRRGSLPRVGGSRAVRLEVMLERIRLVETDFFHDAENWASALKPDFELTDARQGSLVIVDEFGSVLDKILAKKVGHDKPNYDEFNQLLREHRHYYASIILIAQSHHQFGKAPEIKSLVNRWCEVASLKDWIGNGYMRRSYETHYGPNRAAMSTQQGVFRKGVFDLYNSHVHGGKNIGNLGFERDVVAGKSGKGKMLLLVLIVVCAVFFGIYSLLGFLDTSFSKTLLGKDEIIVSAGEDGIAVVESEVEKTMRQNPDFKFTIVDAQAGSRIATGGKVMSYNPEFCKIVKIETQKYLACLRPDKVL